MTRITIGFLLGAVGAVIFALPNMTRPGILFGVAVGQDFRMSPAGRRSITEFRLIVAVTTLVATCIACLAQADIASFIVAFGPPCIVVAGALAYVREHKRVAPFGAEPVRRREAVVTSAPERLPWFVWLMPGPFAILCAAARYLYLNWQNIPARFPVHWGIDAQPDRWNQRTVHAVYGPVLLGAELCFWLLITSLAAWFGARRSRLRRVMLAVLIAFAYMLALLFSGIAVMPLLHPPMWLLLVTVLVFTVPCMVALANALAEPKDSAEPTPNECWKAGIIYYNPSDAALFVEKRSGLGYTLNFGNPWAWVVIAGLVPVLASLPFVM